MDRPDGRSKGVEEVLAQPMPPLAATPDADLSTSFEALYRRTFGRVYAYVASLLRDHSAAEDVTALAFERAYRRRSRYRASRGSPEAWLFGIARNAALDELRARRRRAVLEAEPADVHAVPVESGAEQTLRRETVAAALATLDPRERDLVALKFFAGLTNAEIARVLRISESNTGTRLHRTLERLREACDDDA
jgi:RNA polymerase sigma-70 factor (ECF subfamily)